LFRARGFDDVTATEIARAAGVSRRTLFRHFASKEDIVFGDLAEHLASVCNEVAALPDSVGAVHAIALAALAVARIVDADREVMWNRVLMIARDPKLTARASLIHVQWQDALAAAFASRRRAEPSMRDFMFASVAAAAHANALRFWIVDRGTTSVTDLTRRALAALWLTEDIERR
jgi:AcrR family transcriptional regulator